MALTLQGHEFRLCLVTSGPTNHTHLFSESQIPVVREASIFHIPLLPLPLLYPVVASRCGFSTDAEESACSSRPGSIPGWMTL